MRTKLIKFLATGFYSGLSPKAPGTCGSLLYAAIFYLCSLNLPSFFQTQTLILCSLVVCILAGYVTKEALSLELFSNNKDPKQIVIDEWAGMSIALIFCSNRTSDLLLAFVLFRIFDILKPPPIRTVEELPGALGIVFDDILAGVAAALSGTLISNLIG